MPQLRLKYDPNSNDSLCGAAYIMMGQVEVSHSCGSVAELEAVVARLRRELDAIMREAKTKFDAQRRAKAAVQDACETCALEERPLPIPGGAV